MIFVNKPRKATRKQTGSLTEGQLTRLYDQKSRRGLIVNPPLKGETVCVIRDGKLIKLEDEKC
jgi:hypothetical protein